MNKQAGTSLKNRYTFEEFRSLMNVLSDSLELEDDQLKEHFENLLFYDLKKIEIEEDLVKELPKKVSSKAEALLLENGSNGLIVGMVNPLNTKAINLLESTLGSNFTPVLIEEKDFHLVMGKYYSHIPELTRIAKRFKPERDQTTGDIINASIMRNDVSTLFDLMMQEALQSQATDVHIETFENQLSFRLRVDGILREHKIANTKISQYLLRYIKILANADIAEERRPLDGQHVSLQVGSKKVNIRLSIIPSAFGTSIVMRILGEASHLSLKKIIKDEAYSDAVLKYLKLKQGVFIVSGPTGSGKTTTLLSALSEINTPEKKIITVEDPVEYKVQGITQIQINKKIDYDFGAALRSILRQDPDVIMVGEIRDEETATAAIRAAVTGHMVLATVHTRSVSEIPTRLMDLGVDAFSMSMALRLLVSQRLVRLLCDNCKVPHIPSKEEADLMKTLFPWMKNEDQGDLYEASATGCEFCHHTGYSGRTVIYELLKTDQDMVLALGEKDFKKYYDLVEKSLSGNRLIDRAMRVALSGQTSLEEVLSFNE